MQGNLINLRHLRAFCEVCRHGGISAAAGAIHLSQPAITQAIAKLESEFAISLFDRSSRGMFATEAGRILLNRATRAIDLLQTGASEASRQQKGSVPKSFGQMITSSQLRALIAVSEHGNFTVAARAIGVSQPSLYRMAKDLEKVSGLTLYTKANRGFEMTRPGKTLVRAAKLSISELDQGIDELSRLADADTGNITIGSLPLVRSTILPLAIGKLTAMFPKAKIKVIDSPYHIMLHALRDGEIDVMIGALRDPLPAADVIQRHLFMDKLGVFCGPNHPLLSEPELTTQKLAEFRWVVPRRGTPTRAHFEKFFAQTSVEESGPTIETSSMILVRGLLQDSEYLTMISANQVAADVLQGSLVPLNIELGDDPRPIGLTLRLDWQPTTTQSKFIEFLAEYSETLKTSQ